MIANAATVSTIAIRQFLTFAVAEEEYAIEILKVKEILAYTPLTRVPRAPGFIAGVMNLRGAVVPVIDFRIKLGLPATTVTSRTCIVILDVVADGETRTMGLLTDDVRQVMDIHDGEMQPPPSFGTKIDLSFLLGMGDLGDRFALVLDSDRVLSTQELVAAKKAVSQVLDETDGATNAKKERKARK